MYFTAPHMHLPVRSTLSLLPPKLADSGIDAPVDMVTNNCQFYEFSAVDVPFADKIDLMTEWKVELASRIGAPFIRELVSIEDAVGRFKRGYLGNVRKAQRRGEVRTDIDPELLWMIVEKLGELVEDGSYKRVGADLGDWQRQLRTLLWYGLLSREGDSS